MNTTVQALLELYVARGGKLTDSYDDIAGGAQVGNYSVIPDCISALSKVGGSGETYEALGTIQILGEIDDPSSIGLPDWANAWSLEGAEEIIETLPHDTIYIQKDGEGSYYPLEYNDETWVNNVDLSVEPPVKIRESDPAFALIALGTPIFATSEDWNGSTIGFFVKVEEGGSELPEVTAADNGDVLTVVKGAWAKAPLPENIKSTYEFAFSVSINGDQITFTPAEGVTYAKIAAALAETPHVKAKITLPEEFGASITADFNFSVSGDNGVGYIAYIFCIINSNPTAIALTVGENEGQTICTGLMKTLAVASA